MEYNVYRERLCEAVQEMIDFESNFFTAILNVVLTGELKEWNKTVPIGEIIEFHPDLFDGCDDENVKVLTKLYHHLNSTLSTICNLNSIDPQRDDEYFFTKGSESEDDDDEDDDDEGDCFGSTSFYSGDESEDDDEPGDDDEDDDNDDDWWKQNPFLNFKK